MERDYGRDARKLIVARNPATVASTGSPRKKELNVDNGAFKIKAHLTTARARWPHTDQPRDDTGQSPPDTSDRTPMRAEISQPGDEQ